MRSAFDHYLYFKKNFEYNVWVYLLLYVDYMLLGDSMTSINKIKQYLSDEYEMKDLEYTKRILGMGIFKNRPNRF